MEFQVLCYDQNGNCLSGRDHFKPGPLVYLPFVMFKDIMLLLYVCMIAVSILYSSACDGIIGYCLFLTFLLARPKSWK